MTNVVGFSGVCGLVLILLCCICPYPTDKTSAAENNFDTKLAASVQPSISVGYDPIVTAEVTGGIGGFASGSTKVNVSTNNFSGFTLSMSDTDGKTIMQPSNLTNGTVISSIESPAAPTSADFDTNRWGYYFGESSPTTDSVYFPIPAESTTIISTDAPGNVTYNLSFGAKVDPLIAPGVYTGSVDLTIVANPVVVSDLTSITYMQQMTSDVCENTVSNDKQNPTTKQLIDTRDGKKYWVAKLADGRCWMTQNLALDIKINSDGTSNVKAEDSDVEKDWVSRPTGNTVAPYTIDNTAFIRPGYEYTYYSVDGTTYYPPYDTETRIPPNGVTSPAEETTYSWDLGEYAIINPSSSALCGSGFAVKSLADCVSADVVRNVRNWSPTLVASSTYAVNIGNKTYDSHYLLGNYYQWNTATAGTGEKVYSGTAKDSICPKGWMLPTSSSTKAGSYGFLLSKYGITTKPSGTVNNVRFYISQKPLYFVSPGYMYLANGSFQGLFDVSQTSGYWSSDGNSDDRCYALSIDPSEVRVKTDAVFDRATGGSIRCVNNPNI